MPEDNSFEDWKARFDALQNEANGYGIASMVILCQDDQLARRETITYSHRGSIIKLIGMMDHTWRAIRKTT